MNNKILDKHSPIYDKHLERFRWFKEPGGNKITITYDNMTYGTICQIIGCIVMREDPYFTVVNISQEDIDNVSEIYAMPPWERGTISELFEYFKYECPLKILKKTLKESTLKPSRSRLML